MAICSLSKIVWECEQEADENLWDDQTAREPAPRGDVGAYGWLCEAKQCFCRRRKERSSQGTNTTLQDEIGEAVKRSVGVSEDQSTANGLHSPSGVFVSVFSGRWPAALVLVWQTLESEQKMYKMHYKWDMLCECAIE